MVNRLLPVAAGLAALSFACGCCAEGGGEAPTPLAAASSRTDIARPERSITGATLAAVMPTPGGLRAFPGLPGGYANFISPIAVAARGPDIFIADSGLGTLLRYDRVAGTMTPILAIGASSGLRLHAMPDSTVLVLDPVGRRVLRLTRDGAVVADYAAQTNLQHPVAIAVDERHDRIAVADAFYNYLLVFHSLGRASYQVVPRYPDGSRPLSLSALAAGTDELYAIDRAGHQVLRLDWDGRILQAFGRESLLRPAAIAVDRHGRVFVADAQDARIKMFVQGRPAGTLGGGSAAGGWVDIADLQAGDTRELYVADRATARIDVLRLSPPAGK